MDQVLLRVKQEVGLFESNSAEWHKTYRQDQANAGIIPPFCGTGDINFNITQVKMEFKTVLDTTKSGNLGLKIPFGPAGVGSFGPGVKGAAESTGTSTLDFTYYKPDPNDIGTIPPIVAQNAKIEPTLAALRTAVMHAIAQKPCMSDTPDKQDDTYTFEVELKKDANANLGFNFAILSANAAFDRATTNSNTITVSFHPTKTGGKGGMRAMAVKAPVKMK
jgi:hypothetical protein